MTILRNPDGSLLAAFTDRFQAICCAWPRVTTRPAPRRSPSDTQTEDRRARDGRVGNE